MFPLSIARLIAASGNLPDLASARASIAMGIAFGGGPFAIGVLADGVGVYRSMLVVPVLLTAAGTAVWWSVHMGRRATGDPAGPRSVATPHTNWEFGRIRG